MIRSDFTTTPDPTTSVVSPPARTVTTLGATVGADPFGDRVVDDVAGVVTTGGGGRRPVATAEGAERDQDQDGGDHRRDRGAEPDHPLARAGLPRGEGGGRDERAQLGGVHPGAIEGVRRRAARHVVGLGFAVASGLLWGHGAECTDGPWPFVVARPGRSRRSRRGSQGDRRASFTTMAPCNRPTTG